MIPLAFAPGVAASLGPRFEATRADGAGVRAVRRVLFAGGLVLALGALLRADREGEPAARAGGGSDVVLCLDVSRSMLAQDLAPDRITLARREIRALSVRPTVGRLGLVAFAGEARIVAPLTTDADSVAVLADTADAGPGLRGGTDLGAALDAALGLLGGTTPGTGAIVLLTDGEDHEGRGLAAARRCRERGVTVHALALGTALGGKIPREDGGGFLRDPAGSDVVTRLDPSGLERIADATGGTVAAAPGGSLTALVESSFDLGSIDRGGDDRGNLSRWLLLGAFLLWLFDLALATRARP